MARPRQGVTLDNSSKVMGYFSKALKDSWRVNGHLLADEGMHDEALKALRSVSNVSFCDLKQYRRLQERSTSSPQHMLDAAAEGEKAPNPEELDAWVRKYVSEKGWRLCLNNLRQRRHAIHTLGEKSQVKIAFSTASGLKRLAKERRQSLDELLDDLLKKERGY